MKNNITTERNALARDARKAWRAMALAKKKKKAK